MNKNIQSFLKVLDPEDNSTGGGTASSVAGSMAASLTAMVARLSIGKEGLQTEDFYNNVISEAQVLQKSLFDGGHIDSQAFEAVRGAYRLPKSTNEEKDIRRAAIQAAWVKAAEVPLANAEGCASTLKLILKLRGCSNPNAASDLECAFHLAQAGLKGCIANVAINLPSIKDEKVNAELNQQMQAIIQTSKNYLWE